MNSYNYNRLREEGKKQTLIFNKPVLAELWKEELTGQISDGLWENCRTQSYAYWCGVKVKVDESAPISELVQPVYYNVKRSYRFTSLIKYVGDRMLEIVQKYEPNADEKTLRKYLIEINKIIRGANVA